MSARLLVVPLALLAAAAAASGQPAGKVYRMAIVLAAAPADDLSELRSPLQRGVLSELRRLGYNEGQNLVVERHSGGGRRDSYEDLARAVARSEPHLIFAGSGRVAQAVQTVTSSIPVVTITTDPVGTGLATTLARPGHNVTGFSLDVGLEVLGQRLEVLKEAAPRASRVAYLAPRAVWEARWGQVMREAASRSRVTLIPALLDSPLDEPAYRRAFAALASERAEALLVSDHAEALAHQRFIVDLAAQARLPAIYAYRSFVELGGLAAYAADQQDIARQVADYIDRILKGARPAELPFQQPTKFELVLNMKTARALKLPLPPALLVRATAVIE